MKYILVVTLIAILGLASCSQLIATADNADVNVVFTDNGISVDKIIIVDNFHSGARAETVYSLRNASHAALQPILFVNRSSRVENVDPENIPVANGAITLPDAWNWIEIPDVPEINPGETVNVIVAIEMPDDYEIDADKIGFEISTAAVGKQIQIAVGNWWLINMR